ncbi:MAG TPA: hypothetical protein VFH68_05945 [Polyangia bacterium]|jgi:hypothetical protein|nr:hypothetical protein [Polyangia bacterium]
MESSESGTLNGQRTEGNSSRAGGGAISVGQRVDRVSDTAQEAWSRTRETVNELKERLDIDGRVRRNPYGTMAAALGIGYVLGGGFFSPLTARLFRFGLRIGIRLAAIPFLENEIRGFAEAVVTGSEDDEGESASSSGEGKRSQQKGSKGGKR